jgi:hypothetical protein
VFTAEKVTSTRAPSKRARNGRAKQSKETENIVDILDDIEDDDDDGEAAGDAELAIMIKEHIGSMFLSASKFSNHGLE